MGVEGHDGAVAFDRRRQKVSEPAADDIENSVHNHAPPTRCVEITASFARHFTPLETGHGEGIAGRAAGRVVVNSDGQRAAFSFAATAG